MRSPAGSVLFCFTRSAMAAGRGAQRSSSAAPPTARPPYPPRVAPKPRTLPPAHSHSCCSRRHSTRRARARGRPSGCTAVVGRAAHRPHVIVIDRAHIPHKWCSARCLPGADRPTARRGLGPGQWCAPTRLRCLLAGPLAEPRGRAAGSGGHCVRHRWVSQRELCGEDRSERAVWRRGSTRRKTGQRQRVMVTATATTACAFEKSEEGLVSSTVVYRVR